jgi:CheY-like chemotaxis protein
VEDEPELRTYLRTLLAPTCEVLLASDGQEALDVLGREAPVDLLTTDAMMPRLSGIELLARLRAAPSQAGVPVLMLTARADEAHRLQALTVGVDDYLTKPFQPAELLARVQALLARQQVRRQFAALPPEPVTEAVPVTESPAATLVETTPLPPTTGPDPAAQLAAWQAQLAPYLADSDFGPEEMAAQLLLSRRTLYRRLGELAGLTPAAWLRELRLAHARYLLEAGQVGSVTEVAEAAGFANARYFSSLYAERFGRRPSDYLG